MKRSMILGIFALMAVVALVSATSAMASGGTAYLQVNGTAAATSSQSVTLTVNWPGNVDWCERPDRVANEGGTWQAVVWTKHVTKNYDTWYTATWMLSPGAGAKTISVEDVGYGRKNLGFIYTISDGIQLL